LVNWNMVHNTIQTTNSCSGFWDRPARTCGFGSGHDEDVLKYFQLRMEWNTAA
jgi:hypothetical protein